MDFLPAISVALLHLCVPVDSQDPLFSFKLRNWCSNTIILKLKFCDASHLVKWLNLKAKLYKKIFLCLKIQFCSPISPPEILSRLHQDNPFFRNYFFYTCVSQSTAVRPQTHSRPNQINAIMFNFF